MGCLNSFLNDLSCEKDSELKEEALRNKAIMEGLINEDVESNDEDDERYELCGNETHELSVSNIRRFEMIKYSLGQDEEYAAVKESEYEDLMSTSKEACRAYQEIFRMMDEGWMGAYGCILGRDVTIMASEPDKFDVDLGCADEFKARLASYKFEGDALNWRKPFKQAKGGKTYVATLSWKDFRDIFFLQYFPRSEQQKYEREYHTIRQRDGETSGELMKRFLMLAGFVGKKAGPLEEQAKHFKWALYDWILDGIRGYDQKGYDGRSYDRQGGNSDQKSRHNRGQQYNRSSGSSGQKRYPDYASSPPCDICGKLHPGKACHRVTRACFTCGSTGHMARDCPKNGGNGGRGDENDNQPATKGRVFSSTKDQAANSSGTVSGTLFLNGRAVLSYLIRVQHILWFLFSPIIQKHH
ncbi:putative reverse transcriptase domain-containing protein [Tanacetum coccineum]